MGKGSITSVRSSQLPLLSARIRDQKNEARAQIAFELLPCKYCIWNNSTYIIQHFRNTGKEGIGVLALERKYIHKIQHGVLELSDSPSQAIHCFGLNIQGLLRIRTFTWMCCHLPLVPRVERQEKVDLCEFEDNLNHTMSSRGAVVV